jgi:hypothetical protein
MANSADQRPQLSDEARAALVDLAVQGMRHGEPTAAEPALVEGGYAMRKGPVLMPLPATLDEAARLLRLVPGSAAEQRALGLYDAFLPINRRLRDVCTSWQCRPDGSPNDHSDAAYDAGVRDELDDVHEAITPLLRRLAEPLPRAAAYLPRLEHALDELDSGDGSWLASPVKDSYHTVWMHLHQELLLSLGISRAEDEAREEQLVAGRGR